MCSSSMMNFQCLMPKLYNFLNIILILENQHYVLRGLYNRFESKWRNSNQQSVKFEEDYRPRPSEFWREDYEALCRGVRFHRKEAMVRFGVYCDILKLETLFNRPGSLLKQTSFARSVFAVFYNLKPCLSRQGLLNCARVLRVAHDILRFIFLFSLTENNPILLLKGTPQPNFPKMLI